MFFQALIMLFELPPDESTLVDDHFIEVDDSPGYQAQYAQLVCAKGADSDPLASMHSHIILYAHILIRYFSLLNFFFCRIGLKSSKILLIFVWFTWLSSGVHNPSNSLN